MPNDARLPSARLHELENYLLLLARTQADHVSGAKIDPHDLVQQTLAQAQQNLHQFRGRSDGEFAAWLRAILANHFTDLLRKNGRELDEQALARQIEQSSVRLGEILADEQSSPSQHVAKQERLQRLADTLNQLPDDQRRAIELRYLRDLSMAEVAGQMQRSLPSVGGLLQRGLKSLRAKMKRLDL